jgi:putative transposase
MSLECVVSGLAVPAYGERSDERTNRRNGYRTRAWDTRTGTIDLALPKLREDSYFPDWLLEPRRRAERVFVQVVCESYVRGVSTRRVEGLVRHLGIERISKSRVSQMAKELDRVVETFRSRPLDGGPTRTSGSTRSPRRSARAAGSPTSRWWSPPA